MTTVGQRERLTQDKVVRYFTDQLGYRYLGNRQDRHGNINLEGELLSQWFDRQGTSEQLVPKVLRTLERAATIDGAQSLYDANREFYGLLRYGVKVKPSVDEHAVTVPLVDWDHPERNDFAIAEEVTVAGAHTKRPDLVLYLNGIAVGVIELKRSIVSVTEGIRQNIGNQDASFIRPFFTTVQLLMAGNETEGLRYGVIGTPEKYWLEWKEAADTDNPLEAGLSHLCRKERLLEIIHDFMVFDAGIKKTCRHNQYFGVRAAQERVASREGGIIWHTQGSGKSLTMVWLAKWIREHVAGGRVLIITDRVELDEQIEMVFRGVDEDIHRTASGDDLIRALNTSDKWLMASLIHKFGASDQEGDIDAFLSDVERRLPKGFSPKGEFFVFVDECHRTQSGKLHEAMRRILPNAMLIGFTGTPLLKQDKQRSIEVFGPYIHTYKYDAAVKDGVVLDLRYEARDIDQHVTAQEKVDQWFELKTRGLNDYARAQLKKRWGTLQKVLSSRDRLEKIVSDILWDMETRDRLMSGRGNAMLVAGSIYAACRLFDMFQKTDLKGKCAIVTSYVPSTASISKETSGEGETEKLEQYEIYRRMLAEHFGEPEDTAMNKVDAFEKQVKERFKKEPGQMKLLIVVDKLLTGFDAPPATFLYIDKQMRDHGLFQAICRVNRLHTEDKEVGYIVDYKDLFRSLEQSIKDYTGEAFDGYDADDVEGLLKDRIDSATSRLEDAREAIKALCEPVEPPKDEPAYRRYFVGPSDNPDVQKENEPKRVSLYKLTSSLLRAYAELANDMDQAGYSEQEAAEVASEVEHYERVREVVKLASGDYVDMKVYEPAMRHLLDSYIRADEPQKLSALDDMTLVQLLIDRGEEAIDELPESIKGDKEAVAETIENNVRRLIIDEMAVNPKYYERMSRLLDALIEQRRKDAIDYREYLERIVELARNSANGESGDSYPSDINTPARRALYDNLGREPDLAIAIDRAVRDAKMDNWRGHTFKEKKVRKAIQDVLETEVHESPDGTGLDIDSILQLVKQQHDY
ncbi:MAG: HsdR family type I site-specific deoxyribonuclease [Spirochaetes bacterium]|nr:HsdR family type I site-specific deoxyribonuclease [Spirochaetota bacterium]